MQLRSFGDSRNSKSNSLDVCSPEATDAGCSTLRAALACSEPTTASRSVAMDRTCSRAGSIREKSATNGAIKSVIKLVATYKTSLEDSCI